METIYLYLVLLTPSGQIESQGYSQVTFPSLDKCHQFVEEVTGSHQDVIATHWRPDFAFRVLMTDGSAAMGKCHGGDQF